MWSDCHLLNQLKQWVTASTSIVKLEVKTIYATLSSSFFMDGGHTLLTVKPHPDWSVVTDQCTL